jgi:hypothetical protein
MLLSTDIKNVKQLKENNVSKIPNQQLNVCIECFDMCDIGCQKRCVFSGCVAMGCLV